METLKAIITKNNINLDSSSSNSSSHGHALFSSSFSFTATSTSSCCEWLIDSRSSHHMAKTKAIFLLLTIATPKKYVLVMIDLCSTTNVFQQRMNTLSNHSHN
jgi:hypothetical protein